jgi:hypothetical protein
MSQATEKLSCRSCAYFALSEEPGFIECRRSPPKAPADEPDGLAYFPAFAGVRWCGEFRPGSRGVVK